MSVLSGEESLMIITNLEYNTMKRDLKKLKVQARTMREVLEQIAASKRGGLNKRLASSCLTFVNNCLEPQRKD